MCFAALAARRNGGHLVGEGRSVPVTGTKGAAPATGTEAATRVADVLLLFTEGSGALGISDAARRLGISKAVVHRIMRSLASRGLVTADAQDRTYVLGPVAVALGARALRDVDLRGTALPVLRRLQEATGETTTVSALVGARRMYLDQVESHSEIKMTVELGRAFPLHAGASGRVILAFAPDELRHQVLEGSLDRLTPITEVDPPALAQGLARIAVTGVAVSYGERQRGAGSVAAPVFGIDGAVVGAISACGPVDRFDADTVERLKPRVADAAATISDRLAAGRERVGA